MTDAPSSPNEPLAETPRYRVENGESIVDVRLMSIERVFDNGDPARREPISIRSLPSI